MTTITAVVIFNGHIDKTEKREVFTPTVIKNASYLESLGSSHSGGASTESLSFKLRIPFDAQTQGRAFVNEETYKSLDDVSGNWTLRKGDYILATDGTFPDKLTLPELTALAKEHHLKLIRIVEYADNTIRGTAAVKHWRIGGA